MAVAVRDTIDRHGSVWACLRVRGGRLHAGGLDHDDALEADRVVHVGHALRKGALHARALDAAVEAAVEEQAVAAVEEAVVDRPGRVARAQVEPQVGVARVEHLEVGELHEPDALGDLGEVHRARAAQAALLVAVLEDALAPLDGAQPQAVGQARDVGFGPQPRRDEVALSIAAGVVLLRLRPPPLAGRAEVEAHRFAILVGPEAHVGLKAGPRSARPPASRSRRTLSSARHGGAVVGRWCAAARWPAAEAGRPTGRHRHPRRPTPYISLAPHVSLYTRFPAIAHHEQER